MRHSPHWKIITALMVMLAGVVLAASPGFSEDAQKKTAIVAELQSRELFKSLFERIAVNVRTALREAGIGYKVIKPGPNGVTGEISDATAVDKAREIIAHIAQSGDPVFTLEPGGQKFFLKLPEPMMTTTIDQAAGETLKVLQLRVNDLKLAGASVERQDRDRFLIQLPGSVDPDRTAQLIGQTGKLTFQIACDPQPQNPADNPPEGCAAYAFKSPPDQKIWAQTTTDAILDGNDINQADMRIDSNTNEPLVTFKFNQKGTERLAELTRTNVGRPMAIILDRQVISAPRIVEPILEGWGQISGNFTQEEAAGLAFLLRSGSLPAPIRFISIATEPGADAAAKQQDP